MSFTGRRRSLLGFGRRSCGGWLASGCVSICALYLSGSLLFIDRELTSVRFQLVFSDPTDDVVVVAIDARSLQEISVWRWPRGKHASVIEKLREAATPDRSRYRISATSTPAEDDKLGAAPARAGCNVILPVFEQSADYKSTIDSTAPRPQFAEHTRIALPTSIRTATAPCGDGARRAVAGTWFRPWPPPRRN